jgi:hypothetical protein
LEGVRKAEELQPDLIVLDIGLPTLSGIEAARSISRLSLKSKILFVSQESSADVVREALRIGALGYVVKSHAGSELLAAVEAVLEGKSFVSKGIVGDSLSEATDRQGLDHFPKELSSSAPTAAGITRNHRVQFCSDEESFLNGFALFIEAGLNAGNAVIVIATQSHRNQLLARLQAQGLSIGAAIDQGRYIPLDVVDTLATFMVNDLPDPVRFQKTASDLLDAAAKMVQGNRSRVSACGECAPFLWAQGKADAAIHLEHLWDIIARTYDMDILCGYVMQSGKREQEQVFYDKICAEHSAVCSR